MVRKWYLKNQLTFRKLRNFIEDILVDVLILNKQLIRVYLAALAQIRA